MSIVKIELNKDEYESLMYCTNGQTAVIAGEFLEDYMPFFGSNIKPCNSEDILLFQKV